MEDSGFAGRLIDARAAAGLTQEETARRARVSPATISNIESGKIARPQFRTVRKLAQVLGVSPESLMGNAPKADAPPSSEPEELPEEERRLLNRVRPLIKVMDPGAALWEQMARRGRVSHDVRVMAEDHRRAVLEALDFLLESMAEEGLEWENHRHRPSRRVRRELQAAFNRWNDAWFALEDAFEKGLAGDDLEQARAQKDEQEKRFAGVSEKLRAGEAG